MNVLTPHLTVSPCLYAVPVVHVTAVPVFVTVDIGHVPPPPVIVATVNVISLVGVAPPKLVPRILIWLPTA